MVTLSWKQAWFTLGIILNILIWGTVYHQSIINSPPQVEFQAIEIEWVVSYSDGKVI